MTAFQTALTFGAPLGAAALGGTNPGQLPDTVRLVTGLAAAIWLFAALLVLGRGGYALVGLPEAISRVGTWALVAVLGVGALTNFAPPSPWERFGWDRSRASWSFSAWSSPAVVRPPTGWGPNDERRVARREGGIGDGSHVPPPVKASTPSSSGHASDRLGHQAAHRAAAHLRRDPRRAVAGHAGRRPAAGVDVPTYDGAAITAWDSGRWPAPRGPPACTRALDVHRVFAPVRAAVCVRHRRRPELRRRRRGCAERSLRSRRWS